MQLLGMHLENRGQLTVCQVGEYVNRLITNYSQSKALKYIINEMWVNQLRIPNVLYLYALYLFCILHRIKTFLKMYSVFKGVSYQPQEVIIPSTAFQNIYSFKSSKVMEPHFQASANIIIQSTKNKPFYFIPTSSFPPD